MTLTLDFATTMLGLLVAPPNLEELIVYFLLLFVHMVDYSQTVCASICFHLFCAVSYPFLTRVLKPFLCNIFNRVTENRANPYICCLLDRNYFH
jgi:hypothetical protein